MRWITMTQSNHEATQDLPFVRIKKAVITNMKSVQHGVIEFDCSKEYIPYGMHADILGLYGQNGSGKTTLIEALAILKQVMAGSRVSNVYANCITASMPHAELEFTFDLQYRSGQQRDAVYAFKLERIALSQEEIMEMYKDAPSDFEIPEEEYKVRVYDEVLKLSWTDENGVRKNKQKIFDASTVSSAFGPADKRKEILGKDRKASFDLQVEKEYSFRQSKSFIFSKKTIERIQQCETDTMYFQILLELRHYARYYFHVIDTRSSGLIRLNVMLPIYTMHGSFMLDIRRHNTIPSDAVLAINNEICKISEVLSQLVPGLSIFMKKLDSTVQEDGSSKERIMLMAKRDDIELPLRDESDGIRKIISELSLIIAAYNEPSVTVAIDEFDAGVFEYLLGEVLEVMEETGKGQFIFTSHNLRPLEVLDKKYLYFTTTNPKKRYVRLKGISATNNLRDTYFREILVSEQADELYNRTKRFKLVAALKKAGREDHE